MKIISIVSISGGKKFILCEFYLNLYERIMKMSEKILNAKIESVSLCFANGILTSCRLSNKYHIEDMKYVGEPVIHEQEEKEYRERLEKNRKWLG